MAQQESTLKNLFQNFLKEFRIGEIEEFIDGLDEPLDGKNVDEMLEIVEKAREQIQTKVDEMYTGTNLSRNEVETFMDNPNNFSRPEWQAIERFRVGVDKYTKDFQIASQGAGIREIVKEGRRRSQKKSKLARLDDSKKWISVS
jgi:hypothetical protein